MVKDRCMAQDFSSTTLLTYLLVSFSYSLLFWILGQKGTQNSVWMLPKPPQLPGNWHFKPSAAKTCSHNMFMKCQMLQNDILTVPCQNTPPFLTLCQYYFFPTSTFFKHTFFLKFSASLPSHNPTTPSAGISPFNELFLQCSFHTTITSPHAL